jgi:hypothetical protein
VTPAERTQVVELLEVAHGYSVLGSIMPFRTACIELGTKGSEVAGVAAEAIDRARKEMDLPDKPSSERYRDAIGLALERVAEGSWP